MFHAKAQSRKERHKVNAFPLRLCAFAWKLFFVARYLIVLEAFKEATTWKVELNSSVMLFIRF